jgi:phospholipid/cholesterol/gamma-HCH transport system substrate-binding protein
MCASRTIATARSPSGSRWTRKTPVRADSVATIESLGVTGVSYVSIDAGTPDAPLLIDSSAGGIPVITAGRSTLQALTEEAPELVSETLLVVREIGDLFRGENADRIERTLINAEAASEEFAGALEGFSGIAARSTSSPNRSTASTPRSTR